MTLVPSLIREVRAAMAVSVVMDSRIGKAGLTPRMM